MTSALPKALALPIAARSEPAPASLALRTVKVAASALGLIKNAAATMPATTEGFRNALLDMAIPPLTRPRYSNTLAAR